MQHEHCHIELPYDLTILTGCGIGEKIRLEFFGASHAPAVGCVLTGLPAGEEIDVDALKAFLAERAPGQSDLTTSRSEADIPVFASGLHMGKTTGDAVVAYIENTDIRPDSYQNTRSVPRPGHADYPAFVKYGALKKDGTFDPDAYQETGGGVFSARMTAPLCIAGGLLLQILIRRGITIEAAITEIGGVCDPDKWDDVVRSAREDGDSVGGIIACAIHGLPAGCGEPMYGSVEGMIAKATFGIPAVRGIEFGEGFAAARMHGSEHNDAYVVRRGTEDTTTAPGDTPAAEDVCRIETATNHHGGILGGLTTGMPLTFRVAFKPTPSIAKAQRSVDLATMEEVALSVHGRHDPCVVLRAAPCVRAAAALVAAELIW